jgi:hypothetical protein
MAQGFGLGEIGLLYYVMASSERLADALRNAERFLRVQQRRGAAAGFSREYVRHFEYVNIDCLSDRQPYGILARYLGSHLPSPDRQQTCLKADQAETFSARDVSGRPNPFGMRDRVYGE